MDKDQLNIDTDNLELASISSRVKAFVIDDLLITLVVLLMLWDKIAPYSEDFVTIMNVMNTAFLQIVVLKFIYQTFFTWYYGATIGKIVAKIKVIDFDNFGRVSFISSMLRSSGRIVSEAAFFLGFILAYFTDSRQTFHDKIGKTLVVNV